MFKQLHLNITLAEALVLMPKYQKMLKALLSNKEKLQELANTPLNENYSAVILKKLPKKLGDPGKFLIPCGFSELKCKALADLGASINLMSLSVWKKLGLPDLIPTLMTLELANRTICTPDGIARDVFVPVGKFTFPADFVVVDYESDPRVPLILGRLFLRTACALIDVHGEEMILRDGEKRLTLNMKHDTTSYSNHPCRESVNLINIFNLSCEDCLKDLVSHKQSGNPTFSLHKKIASPEVIHEFYDSKGCTFLSEELPDIDSFNDIHPYFDDDPLRLKNHQSHTQALEILKLKKRAKKLEKKRRSKSSRRMHPNRRKIEAIDDDEDITLVDMENQVDMDDELQGRICDDNAATKDANAAEPTTSCSQEKAKKNDLERAQVLQQQYDDKEKKIDWNAVAEQVQERHLDNIRKGMTYDKVRPIFTREYKKVQTLFRPDKDVEEPQKKRVAEETLKPVEVSGMTYDNVRPIFEREYKKVQTLFKPDKDVEEPQKKRVAEETLLQESFKKLEAVEVSGSESTQETPTNDPKEMSEEDVQNMLETITVSEFKVKALHVKHPIIDWEIHSEGSRSYWKIIRVGGITEAYQSFEDILKGFDREDLVALWRLVKETFSSAVPNVDKEKALWVELKRLFTPDADDVLWKLQRHDMFMLTEKDYPLSNGVMTLMVSAKLQVEEDCEMARDLVMKIFMEANKPKNRIRLHMFRVTVRLHLKKTSKGSAFKKLLAGSLGGCRFHNKLIAHAIAHFYKIEHISTSSKDLQLLSSASVKVLQVL
nr:reverse transcriptase domain-containing protein [Tanacetum cinerariifolium]